MKNVKVDRLHWRRLLGNRSSIRANSTPSPRLCIMPKSGTEESQSINLWVSSTVLARPANSLLFEFIVLSGSPLRGLRFGSCPAFSQPRVDSWRTEFVHSTRPQRSVPACLFPACRSLKRAQSSLKCAQIPDLLTVAFAHIRNNSCRLAQHLNRQFANKQDRFIGALTVDWVIKLQQTGKTDEHYQTSGHCTTESALIHAGGRLKADKNKYSNQLNKPANSIIVYTMYAGNLCIWPSPLLLI